MMSTFYAFTDVSLKSHSSDTKVYIFTPHLSPGFSGTDAHTDTHMFLVDKHHACFRSL